MAISPKEAAEKRKLMTDDAVCRVEDFIDEKLARYSHPDFPFAISIPLDSEALNFLSHDELLGRLSETYRKNGWDVKREGTMLQFSLVKAERYD